MSTDPLSNEETGQRVVEPAVEKQRLRFTYEKGETVKFISHQDEFRLWERTLRRADLPLLYKQGFNPQPHMQFAAALGLGMTGVAEMVDVVLSPPLPPDEVARRVAARLPPGVILHGVAEIPLKEKSLQASVIGADYTILIYADPGEIDEQYLQARIDAFLAQEEVWRQRERHGQPYRYNLRPLVFELSYTGYDAEHEQHQIQLRVQARDGATGRPDEVVDALGFDDYARTLRRDRIYFAHLEEDAALFARYPVITQDAISPERPQRRRGRNAKRRRRDRTTAAKAEGLQSFAEKAADEFGNG